jgi:glycerol-3-phosphate acyltransferase PlsX
VKIAVDAMGGDHAPAEIVKGACRAAAELGVEILLVGDESRITPLLASLSTRRVEIRHAPDIVEMGAHPIEAVRRQKESSIVVAAGCVKRGEAHALVSAGSTGAAMAAALLSWGRIKGIERPAIGTVIPSLQGACVLLDAGAQVDTRPAHLHHFALMGSIYTEQVLAKKRPRVGLLNIGEEKSKGSQAVQEAYARLQNETRLNFIGNIEGRDILPGKADVVVCDGFVGNVVLKFAEGMAGTIFSMLKRATNTSLRSRIGALFLRKSLEEIRTKLDYTEYGGAPLLGLQGVCIIYHGSSNAKAIFNAVRVASESVSKNVVECIAAVGADRDAP